MASLEDLEARVAAIEEKLRSAREDAAAARVLAGGADRDVAQFRQTQKAHTSVLNALRETQVEQGQQQEAFEQAVNQRFETLEAKVDSGFTQVNIAVGKIATLLQRVIDKD